MLNKKRLSLHLLLTFVFFSEAFSEDLDRSAGTYISALMPATLPDPLSSSCSLPPDSGEMRLYAGTNVFRVHHFPHIVVLLKGQPLLVLNKNAAGGLTFTGDFFDASSNLVARVRNNRYEISKSKVTTVVRADKSTIVVYVGTQVVFQAKYLNPNAVSLQGDMHVPGGDVDFDAGSMNIGTNSISESCLESGVADVVVD